MPQSLSRVKRAAGRRVSASAAFKQAIIDAHAEGHSLRAIGLAAGITHVRVLKILRGE